MKGIVLAGGRGTRLYPATETLTKHRLAVYDKPMIYYPLATLMLAGIKDIMIISTPRDLPAFKKMLGDGSQLGLNLSYKVQNKPHGIAHSFKIGKDFIRNDKVALILGDNLFYGPNLSQILRQAALLEEGAVVFGYYVQNPEDFGVVDFDEQGKALSLAEKPNNPQSHYAVPGLYFYDNTVIDKVKQLKPSARGELEITDLNRLYLAEEKLQVQILTEGTAWLDAGTPTGLLKAAKFVKTVQKRQGVYIACLEEIAYKLGYIGAEEVKKLAQPLLKNDYGQHLLKISEGKLDV